MKKDCCKASIVKNGSCCSNVCEKGKMMNDKDHIKSIMIGALIILFIIMVMAGLIVLFTEIIGYLI